MKVDWQVFVADWTEKSFSNVKSTVDCGILTRMKEKKTRPKKDYEEKKNDDNDSDDTDDTDDTDDDDECSADEDDKCSKNKDKNKDEEKKPGILIYYLYVINILY